MSLTIVADDLTGACDSGALFCREAAVPVAVWPGTPPAAAVRVVDTETRTRPALEAADRVRAAAAACPAALYFKKIDSTLRGRIGAEVEALMAVAGLRSAIVCPAFPAQGRRLVDRVLTVDGTPVAETAVARDPDFPCRPGDRPTSSVVDLLRSQTERPLAWLPLGHVRSGAGALAARLERLTGTVAVADAAADTDLDALVDAALARQPSPLLVGAAALARALAARLGWLAPPARVPRGDRWLIVAGSRHPATRRQVAGARAAGIRVLSTPEEDTGDRRRAVARLADQARKALDRETFDLVVVAGGETAIALWAALEAQRIDLVGAPAPGLALGYLRARRHPGLPLLTKAGGFGEPDLFVSLMKEAIA